jgi:ketosteroid isomerase-like protein
LQRIITPLALLFGFTGKCYLPIQMDTMKKISILAIAIALSLSQAEAQKFPTPLQAIVDAEWAFAQTSKETNTVNAFVSHLSPTATFLIQGEEVNGRESWKSREPDNSLLYWYPVYADISSSEDFGYTTGPYSYYSDRKDTVPAFRGYYSTVWAKEANGEWKVLFDLGSGISTEDSLLLSTSRIKLKLTKKRINKAGALEDLLKTDKTYLETLRVSGKSFNPDLFSEEGRIHRPRQLPIIGAEKIKLFKEENQKFEHTALNGKIATSGDMGYTYGKTKVTLNKEGTERVLDLSYFRIWKKEDSVHWKIVLDVVGQ